MRTVQYIVQVPNRTPLGHSAPDHTDSRVQLLKVMYCRSTWQCPHVRTSTTTHTLPPLLAIARGPPANSIASEALAYAKRGSGNSSCSEEAYSTFQAHPFRPAQRMVMATLAFVTSFLSAVFAVFVVAETGKVWVGRWVWVMVLQGPKSLDLTDKVRLRRWPTLFYRRTSSVSPRSDA